MMKDYISYLEKEGYSSKAIPIYRREILRFETWMIEYGTTRERIDYKVFLEYISYLKQRVIKVKTVQNYIISLKIYFTYLQHENYRSDHPIENIKIQGMPKTIIKNLLDSDELEYLYYSYEVKGEDLWQKRDKIIIGLLVYQGLHTKELQYLQEEHVSLYKGTITIPETKRTNERILEFKPWQVLGFMEYMNEIRPQLVVKTKQDPAQLFFSSSGSLSLEYVIKRVTKALKNSYSNYQNANQIRSSVIVNWLGQYNLRKVQYMAGHRYISSTERYKQDDLESLHEMITSFHPIR